MCAGAHWKPCTYNNAQQQQQYHIRKYERLTNIIVTFFSVNREIHHKVCNTIVDINKLENKI